MISVVVVYDREEILKEYLLSSLEKQTVKFEFVGVDNTKGEFKSAAEALNEGAERTNGKYIIFVHQDARLGSPSWLEEAERILDSLPCLGAAGVAGRAQEEITVTTIMHGNPPRLSGEVYPEEPTKVQTLDECLLMVPRTVFSKLKFDEEVCDGWHLYGVDYSLSIKSLGLNAYIIPLPVYHLSTGIGKNLFQIFLSLEIYPKEYYRTLPKLLRKHRGVVKICTTCGNWNPGSPLLRQKISHLMQAGIKRAARFLAKQSRVKKGGCSLVL